MPITLFHHLVYARNAGPAPPAAAATTSTTAPASTTSTTSTTTATTASAPAAAAAGGLLGLSPRAAELRLRLAAFMEEHVYPAEEALEARAMGPEVGVGRGWVGLRGCKAMRKVG